MAHRLFPGKQSDVLSIAEASKDPSSRPHLGSFVVVADGGTVSDARLQALRDDGLGHVIAESNRCSKGSGALRQCRKVQAGHAPAGGQ